MRPEMLLYDLNLYEWMESLLPDFILSFAFFTSVSFAVLGKQFEHKRAAIAISAAIGFALSTGLVWWEQANNLSIRNLGPIAVGFAVIVLSFVMYQSIKKIGGSWAGAGLTLGACIIIASIIGLKIPVDTEIVQSIIVTALIIGIFAFLIHTSPNRIHLPVRTFEQPDTKINMARLFRDRHLSNDLSKNIRKIRREAASLDEQPQDAGNIILQIKRMLPAEGYLTERMAQLRAKAHQIRNGHIARLEETKSIYAQLPVSTKKKASADMTASYNQLIGIDTRLERLDRAVAENERAIKILTQQAQKYTVSHEYKKLTETLKKAEKLQKHNSHLFKIIERTENKLTTIAKKIAGQANRLIKNDNVKTDTIN